MGTAAIRAQPRLAGVVRSPPARALRVDNAVLGMALFLATEIMLFAGLVSGLLILRAGSAVWPPPDQPRLPALVTALNTLVLLLSAYTMTRATSRRPQPAAARVGRLIDTALLGMAFLAVQGVEWWRLLRYGLHASSSLYGATFYTIIGCHAAHVVVAVVALAVLVGRARSAARRRQPLPALDAYRLYWLFVVGIWPILYVLVYLL